MLFGAANGEEVFAIKAGELLVDFATDTCDGQVGDIYHCSAPPDSTFRYALPEGVGEGPFVVDTIFKPDEVGDKKLEFRLETKVGHHLFFIGLDGKDTDGHHHMFFYKSNTDDWNNGEAVFTAESTLNADGDFHRLHIERHDDHIYVSLDGNPIPGMAPIPDALTDEIGWVGWHATLAGVEVQSLSTGGGVEYPLCIKQGFRGRGHKIGTWPNVMTVDDCSSGCLANDVCEGWSYDSKILECTLIRRWPERPVNFRAGAPKMQSGKKKCNNGTPIPLGAGKHP